MALPTMLQQNAINNEKESLNILREQRDIMKKLQESIVSNQKEYGSLRKDMNSLKQEFMVGIKSFENLQKYFENMKSDRVKEKQIQIKDNKETGFFSKAIAKLLGKKESGKDYSDLQEKLLQETETIKTLASNTNGYIKFIKRSYEPNEKAKDRELLAEAIANKIGDGKSGMGGLFASLITAIGIGLATLGTAIITGIGSKIASALSELGKFIRGVPVTPGTTTTDKSKPQQKPASSSTGMWAGITRFLGGVGAALAPTQLGDSTLETYKERKRQEYEQNPDQLQKDLDKLATEAQFQEILKTHKEKFGENSILAKDFEEAEDKEEFMLEYINRFNENLEKTGGSTARLDEIVTKTHEQYLRWLGIFKEQTKTQEEVAKKDEEDIEAKKDNIDLQTEMTNKLKGLVGGLSESFTGENIKNMVKDIFKLDLGNGQQLDLFPGLSESISKGIDMMQSEIKELSSSDVAGMVNTAVNNVTNVGGSTTTVLPDASARDGSIDNYRASRPLR